MKNKLKLMSLDTEDNSKGSVDLINFYDGENHHTFKTRKEALNWLLHEAGSNLDIWCTNLQYDLINTFGDQLHLLEINYVGSRIISAKLSNMKVYFKDTLNHWKMSVAEMGKRINHHKLEGDIFDENNRPTMEQLITRCHRDSEITYKFVETMGHYYNSIGAKLKATIGSTAMDYFQTHHYKNSRKQLIKTKDLEFLQSGYYGGRTEIFFNNPIEGNIQYMDYNSLYPATMFENDFPIITENCYKRTKNPNLNNHGIAHVTIICPDDIILPYLPYRSENGGLIFPIGVLTGHWTFFEIREAIKLGYVLKKIHTSIEFNRGNFFPFKDFVKNLYQNRMEAKKQKDDLLADSYKLIMNNLYGKYAQGREFTKLIPYTNKNDLQLGDTILAGMILRTKKGGKFPIHTNFIWSALTTAYGRDKLYKGMIEVIKNKGLLIYCDTDSIIFESNKKIFKDNHDLGGLKSEGDFKYAWFKLPKLYKLIAKDNTDQFKAKGIPKKHAKDFFNLGSATFRKPYKLREALRRNMSPKRKVKLIPNYWEEITKNSIKTYDKRIVFKDGTTKPLKIEGN